MSRRHSFGVSEQMKRSGFKIDYQTGLAKRLEKQALRAKRKPKEPRYGLSQKPRKALGYSGRKGKPLRTKPDRKLIAWGKAVRERDGNRCQWPGGCQTGDTRIDAHHIAERSLRPDLRLILSNGIALCRSHHSFLENHRAVGIALKLISTETYEAARKKAA